MIFEKEILEFLLADKKELLKFSHRTHSEKIARQIVASGFEFSESLQKTTDPIIDDQVYLNYWHNLRVYYGPFTIVICIAKTLFLDYIKRLDEVGNNNILVEHILTVKEPVNDNQNYIYTLPNQYIKGYFNSETGAITANPDFDPYFDSPIFLENLEKLKQTNAK